MQFIEISCILVIMISFEFCVKFLSMSEFLGRVVNLIQLKLYQQANELLLSLGYKLSLGL